MYIIGPKIPPSRTINHHRHRPSRPHQSRRPHLFTPSITSTHHSSPLIIDAPLSIVTETHQNPPNLRHFGVPNHGIATLGISVLGTIANFPHKTSKKQGPEAKFTVILHYAIFPHVRKFRLTTPPSDLRTPKNALFHQFSQIFTKFHRRGAKTTRHQFAGTLWIDTVRNFAKSGRAGITPFLGVYTRVHTCTHSAPPRLYLNK